MPQVSVIIPVYNTQNYLKKCLGSVCNQTLSDIEIICVNDCSTDNSLDILTEYSKKDSRIKLIDFKENKGAAIARNIGIDAAKGEYIGFVDSDDFIDLDFYEKLFQKAIDTRADIVKASIKMYDFETGKAWVEDWLDINDLIKKDKAYFNNTFTTAIYNRRFVLQNTIKFPINHNFFEDPFFAIQASFWANEIQFVSNTYYYYCNNSCSTTRKNITFNHIEATDKIAKQILNFLNNNNVDKDQYVIIFDFVFKQILTWCNMRSIPDNLNSLACKSLFDILELCKYKKESLEYHFLFQKNEEKRLLFKKLRAATK